MANAANLANLANAALNPEWMQKARDDWEARRAKPDWRAMEKLEASIAELKNDPEIAASEGCRELLGMIQELLDRAWPHHNAAEIVSPLKHHFDGKRSEDALEKKQQKQQKKREMFHNFLSEQKDISDTPRLASRLRSKFEISTVRVAEEEVRRWKKLHAAGKA